MFLMFNTCFFLCVCQHKNLSNSTHLCFSNHYLRTKEEVLILPFWVHENQSEPRRGMCERVHTFDWFFWEKYSFKSSRFVKSEEKSSWFVNSEKNSLVLWNLGEESEWKILGNVKKCIQIYQKLRWNHFWRHPKSQNFACGGLSFNSPTFQDWFGRRRKFRQKIVHEGGYLITIVREG